MIELFRVSFIHNHYIFQHYKLFNCTIWLFSLTWDQYNQMLSRYKSPSNDGDNRLYKCHSLFLSFSFEHVKKFWRRWHGQNINKMHNFIWYRRLIVGIIIIVYNELYWPIPSYQDLKKRIYNRYWSILVEWNPKYFHAVWYC